MTSVIDVTAWLPPDMDAEDKEYFASLYPGDPHRCAAEGWEAWAASLALGSTGGTDGVGGAVRRISTGSQAIEYVESAAAASSAFDRANWHRARAKVRSVEIGPTHTWGWLDETETVVPTYESPPMPVLRATQVQLPDRRVGQA